MAENLNYDVPNNITDVCYNDEPDNCDIYGKLYDWATAMDLPSICNTSTCSNKVISKHQGICPSGWHIPNYIEWNNLIDYVETPGICTECAGKKLRTESLWSTTNGTYIAGTDDYGFAALPGGSYTSIFSNLSVGGSWWDSGNDNNSFAYLWFMTNYMANTQRANNTKTFRYSVRCVKD